MIPLDDFYKEVENNMVYHNRIGCFAIECTDCPLNDIECNDKERIIIVELLKKKLRQYKISQILKQYDTN